MLEDINELDSIRRIEQEEKIKELTDASASYLRELNVTPEIWSRMSQEQRSERIDLLQCRMEELKIDSTEHLKSTNLLSPEMLEELNKRLEAPNDMVQIERVADSLKRCEELKFDNWKNLELQERVRVLNNIERQIAHIEHRPSCPIKAIELREGLWGGYNPETKSIDINKFYIEESGTNPAVYKEIIDTLVHEGRHAYQDYNVNERVVHPRQSEVDSWAETMEGGKWGYWGDCSTELGWRLYEQQSIEIDARNFAADVVSKLEDAGDGKRGSVSFLGKQFSYESANDTRDIAKSELLSALSSNHIYPGSVYTDKLWGGLDYYSGNKVRDAINKARDNGSISDTTYKRLMQMLKKACHHQ